jgi:hypothetical protein
MDARQKNSGMTATLNMNRYMAFMIHDYFMSQRPSSDLATSEA